MTTTMEDDPARSSFVVTDAPGERSATGSAPTISKRPAIATSGRWRSSSPTRRPATSLAGCSAGLRWGCSTSIASSCPRGCAGKGSAAASCKRPRTRGGQARLQPGHSVDPVVSGARLLRASGLASARPDRLRPARPHPVHDDQDLGATIDTPAISVTTHSQPRTTSEILRAKEELLAPHIQGSQIAPRNASVAIEDVPRVRLSGAGEGNRTLVVSLGSFCSAIELHPHRRR